MNYYYNNVPGKGLCRNNLIYTSLINEQQTEFVQWYFNDTEYHQGKNEIVDPNLMDEKWQREITMLARVDQKYVPEYKINETEKKIHLKIQGVDFWEMAGCNQKNYSDILPDWQEQMLEILQMHKSMGIYKFSLHPSSYFIVDGKLKSINYFFAYHKDEPKINVRSHLSHISLSRQEKLFPQMASMRIDVDKPQDWNYLHLLCMESFSDQYPRDFIDKAKEIYV
jgi:hypothetical protein